jgi:hypothetical protein
MSDRLPIDERARERLREAQRSESAALKTVAVAARAHRQAVARMELTQMDLNAAYAALAKVSGEWRAARLTGLDVKVLRHAIRNAKRNGAKTE